jgi:hypothetical protein
MNAVTVNNSVSTSTAKRYRPAIIQYQREQQRDTDLQSYCIKNRAKSYGYMEFCINDYCANTGKDL